MRQTKHPLFRAIVLALIATAFGIWLALQIDWFPESASTAAPQIDWLYDVLMIVSVPIFVLVMTVAIYSVWQFRAKPGDKGDGAPIHGNTLLEVVWVAVPFLIVAALAAYGWVVLVDIEKAEADAITVDVTGQQYTWSFAYPDDAGGEPVRSSELVLPVNRQVDFQIKALDVLHSFWVPEFRLKSDAVPGITTHYPVTPTREGEFQVVCAELCGIGHSTMRQPVRVVSQEEFDSWLDEQAAGGEAAGAETPAEQNEAGSAVFADNGCAGCHEFGPAGATGTTGPSLDDLAAVAEEHGEDPEAFVEESIVDPDAVVEKGYAAGTMPPNYGETLTPEEITALVQYLLGSSGGEQEEVQ
jgi:cytochrome c oxidase subunit 2